MVGNIYVQLTVQDWRLRIRQALELARRAVEAAEEIRDDNLDQGRREMKSLITAINTARSTIAAIFRPRAPILKEEGTWLSLNPSLRIPYVEFANSYPHLEIEYGNDWGGYVTIKNKYGNEGLVRWMSRDLTRLQNFLIEFEATVGKSGLVDGSLLRFPVRRIALRRLPYTEAEIVKE